MDSHRKRSTLHRLSVVCPMNDNHEGPETTKPTLPLTDAEMKRLLAACDQYPGN